MSVLMARRGSSAVRPIISSGAAPGITGTVNASATGSAVTFASLPSSSLSYLAIIMAVDNNGTTPTAPSGWALLSSGSNSNDPTWSRWWAFVGSSSAAAGSFGLTGNQGSSGILIGFDSATTITLGGTPAQPSVGGVTSTSLNSPSFTLPSDGLVVRSVIFNSTTASSTVVTPPSGATLGRATNTLNVSGSERATVAVASETKSAGAAGTATWGITGSGIYQPVAHSFQVLKA